MSQGTYRAGDIYYVDFTPRMACKLNTGAVRNRGGFHYSSGDGPICK